MSNTRKVPARAPEADRRREEERPELKRLREENARPEAVLASQASVREAAGRADGRLADDADRIEVLERALGRIRDRAVGLLADPESSSDDRLQAIYVIAVSALAGFADPADLQ